MRTLRALRPLRAMSRMQGMRVRTSARDSAPHTRPPHTAGPLGRHPLPHLHPSTHHHRTPVQVVSTLSIPLQSRSFLESFVCCNYFSSVKNSLNWLAVESKFEQLANHSEVFDGTPEWLGITMARHEPLKSVGFKSSQNHYHVSILLYSLGFFILSCRHFIIDNWNVILDSTLV